MNFKVGGINLKKTISLIISAVLSLSLIGCGSSSTQQTASNTNGKVTLKVWSYYNDNEKKSFNNLVDKFNKSQDKVEVVNEYVPFADIKKQFSVGIAAQNLPDLAVIDNPDHAAFAAMGMFEDITDKVKDWDEKDNYFEGPWKSTMYNGKNYGIPMDSNCLALFYNEDLLKQAGVTPPQTWDELRTAAKKLTKDGVYGLSLSAVKSEEGTFQFMPFLLSSGGSVEKVNSPEVVKSLQLWTDLLKDGSLSKECINWDQPGVEKQFATGKAAMMINGPWQFSTLKSDAPNMKWACVKIPKDQKYASVLGGENIGIVKGHHPEEAWEFLKFIGKADNVRDFINNTGYFPPRKDLANDKVWTEDPNKAVFMDQMQYAMPRGPHPKWPQISEAIYTAYQESLTMQKSPQEALDEAQTKIDAALK